MLESLLLAALLIQPRAVSPVIAPLIQAPLKVRLSMPLFELSTSRGGIATTVTSNAFPLLAPDGTAAAPSYAFASAPSNGLSLQVSGTYLVLASANGVSGTDTAGTHLLLKAGRGRGAGASGSFYVSMASNGNPTGSSVNSEQNVLTFNGDNFLVGGISSHTAGTGQVSGYVRSTTDTDGSGGSLTMIGGPGTGLGIGGNVAIQAAPAGPSTGTTSNALQTVLATNTTTGDLQLNGLLLASGVRGAVSLGQAGGAGTFLKMDRTVTAAGTTGARTIDKMAGTVNFAAAATAIVVTNNQVNANSIIFCTVRTNDTTAILKNCVPGTGSFTINLNAAATAETSVGFWVTN